MPKFIREIRMGPPKTFKTGSVVGTYPKPMLVLEGDEGGLDVVKEPIEWIEHFENWMTVHPKDQPVQPRLYAIQFAHNATLQLQDLFGPVPDKESFPEFNKVGNVLFTKGCPFKTVVIDPVTILSNAILSYFAQTNATKMADARKWASAVGQKTQQTIAAFFTLKCHVVCIMHTATNKIVNDKGEITSMTEEPVIFSKLRDTLGSLPSQFFYQDSLAVGGKLKCRVQTMPDSRIKGIGCRWPSDLPSEISPPTFDMIYGKSVLSGECEK